MDRTGGEEAPSDDNDDDDDDDDEGCGGGGAGLDAPPCIDLDCALEEAAGDLLNSVSFTSAIS